MDGLDFMITPFRLHDLAPLTQVIDSVCADTPWMQTGRFEPTPAWRHALATVDCPHHLLVLARLDGRVIGWGRLFPVAGQPGVVELGIGVLRPYRHRGVGTALLTYGFEWVEAAGVAKMMLTTHVHNRPALGLFCKFGFGERSRMGELVRMGRVVSCSDAPSKLSTNELSIQRV